ncbi:SpoIIE family protein phosphatase [Pseudonocardia lacus]|uniref:SpoIIE family protein phosphatase n=1 Tax=Pseudonocardia lacus TaxID=2835865 RepID=UPI001BDC397A|nr:SpoIIE family protein phosphatase [Pseudonocardia lacus]
MPVQLERRIRLPPDARSAGRARRMVQGALEELDPDREADLADTTILLASELCENAVLHAGTEFEVTVTITEDEVTVAVADRGAGPLELHLAQPRQRYGRAATHGRGLTLVQRLSTAWGTRHDNDGRHAVWFSMARRPRVDRAVPLEPVADTDRVFAAAEQARWLLHVPPGLADRLEPLELVGELSRRLRELLGADLVSVEVDEADGTGPAELVRDGDERPGRAGAPASPAMEVRLPMTAPLRGTLRVLASDIGDERTRDLVELTANRVAMAVEARWLRAVDQRRRAWMTYLAETSELLGQSLDVELAVAVVPQVVVPRLGRWCAVHLVDPTHQLRLAALTHADEDQLPELRAVLDPAASPGLPRELAQRLAGLVRDGSAPVRFAAPTDGIALALRARGTTIGTLIVGRPPDRPHTPEDIMMAGDVARRAALSIHNAQSTAAHVDVSQALQQALLPRALPVVPGVEFAAEYLSASSGSDVGGDFYDVLTVDPTHWHVAIGDVCGKGARAAARTGLVRDVLRVLVRDGRALPRAVELLNDVMMEAEDPLQFCTLAAAMVSRSRPGTAGLDVELLLAGHVQPVLVRADGTASLVGRFGTAVGLVPRMRLECTTHHLDRGDVFLAYTDGVTERRRGREQFGPDRLLEVAAKAAGRSAKQVVAAVREAVERFSAEPLDDDVALLAIRAAR